MGVSIAIVLPSRPPLVPTRTVESAVELMPAGAFDYIVKPIGPDSLLPRALRANENLELARSLLELRVRVATSGASDTILGETRTMVEIVAKLPQHSAVHRPSTT